MTDFLKIAKSIAVHFAHICAYGVETVKPLLNVHSKVGAGIRTWDSLTAPKSSKSSVL